MWKLVGCDHLSLEKLHITHFTYIWLFFFVYKPNVFPKGDFSKKILNHTLCTGIYISMPFHIVDLCVCLDHLTFNNLSPQYLLKSELSIEIDNLHILY